MSKKLDWLKYGMLPIPVMIKLWDDEELLKSFKVDPARTLKGLGYEIDDSIQVKITENSDKVVNLVIPAFPSEMNKMSESDFKGMITMTTKCGATGTCD